MNQDEQVFKALRDRGGIEPAKVTCYHAHRPSKTDVTLEVHDAGEGNNTRFMVFVRDDAGRVAMGNPQATLEDALELVHWGDVDMADYE